MIRYASYSDIGGRTVNEDSLTVRVMQNNCCAVLGDGLGGCGGGDRASGLAVSVIGDGWKPNATPDELSQLVQTAHQAVLSIQTPSCQMKTTIVILSLTPEQAAYAYAGDSRLYQFVNGNLVWQSRDHSASYISVLTGDITEADIRFHKNRHLIYRALGQRDGVKSDCGHLTLQSGRNAFLLCSDGFWEYVYESEMQSLLTKSNSPQHWIDRMRELLTQRAEPDHDNNSAIAIWFDKHKRFWGV